MMRRFVKTVSALLAAGAALVSLSTSAQAQEIQLTGPLAGAPAVRKLRLHREGRFDLEPGVSFSLLDQYMRTIMPGATLTYHVTDWIGFGLYGGYGFQYQTGLADELQTKAIDGRKCASRPFITDCRLTAVNLTHGNLANDQLGHIQWLLAPQVVLIPFRGKVSLFSSFFLDTDIAIFGGPAFVGLKERASCGKNEDGTTITTDPSCADQSAGNPHTAEASRVAITGTFGLGLNFYPTDFLGVGVDFRLLPMSWNTSGFDNHGGGTNKDFPDNSVNGADREFHMNSFLNVHVKVAFPITAKTTL